MCMDKKTTILQCALKLYLTHGYENVSMGRIAAEMNVTKPALYYHFKNKKDLDMSVVKFFSMKMRAWSMQYFAGCGSFYEFLKRHFESLDIYKEVVPVLLDGARIAKATYGFNDLLSRLTTVYPEVRSMLKTSSRYTREILTSKFKLAQKRGEIRNDIDCEVMALQLNLIIEGTSIVFDIDDAMNIKEYGHRLFLEFWKSIKK